ncbi:MAG: SMP-30/gluconolactonase/LRE family protein [Alphaproteobacteria bacterium]|nr:MAG: SMP-30/gluconolactonase/LRE family protein [Alphaproteobacteria bacterium]
MEFTRRHLTAAAGAAAATTFTRTALGGWEPSERYPDPAIQILDPSFAKYRLALAGVERLATGMRWCEGPVYFGDARCVMWSDIPNNRILRWDETTGRTSVYRRPSNNANGNTRDRQGRLVTCEHDTRRVTRTEYDGSISVLIDKFDGNLWCGWGMGSAQQDGVKIFDPTGKPIGFIALPERCANVCFGGVKRNRLFMAASHSLYSLYVNTQGAPGG